MLLATLQYRWLGQVSEAEREQLRRSVAARASEFGVEFDTEITRVYEALQDQRDAASRCDVAAVGAALERWRTSARFPGLVREVYLVESRDAQPTLRRFDLAAGSCEPVGEEWPSRLEEVRRRLASVSQAKPPTVVPPPAGRTQVVAISITPALPSLPGLLIPLATPLPPGGTPSKIEAGRVGAATWPDALRSWLVVEFDDEYLRRSILPALAARQFPETGAAEYRLAVLPEGDGPALFTRGIGAASAIRAEKADAVQPFFAVRFDLPPDVRRATDLLTFRTDGHAASGAQAGPPNAGNMAIIVEHRSISAASPTSPGNASFAALRLATRGWRLVVRHPLGSLDAAVASARRRNLALGFGILGVLCAGLILVAVSARRAAQLAARQMEFVATVTHELRTPLSVIRVAGHNLATGVVHDEAQTRQYGTLVENEGRRLSEMVEQVLDFAGLSGRRRLQAVEAVVVADVVREAVASCEQQAMEAGVTLETVVPEALDGAVVQGDRAALVRAVQNLVHNAIKHAADGRLVHVSLATSESRRAPGIRIVVSDHGPGIAASDLPHVFEPFFRGRRAVENQVRGNGLGLSLVKRIVEAHGGRVQISSTASHGTSVTLGLPLASPTDAARPDRLGEEVRP